MRSKKNKILFAWIILSLWACNSERKLDRIVIEEKAGIARDLEYVKIMLTNHQEKVLFFKNILTKELIRGEKLNQNSDVKDTSFYIFPIAINANEKKTFIVTTSKPEIEMPLFSVKEQELALKVENDYFIADFSTNEAKSKRGLHYGQLTSIFINDKKVLLQRNHNNMHWAPNFQKEDLHYKTIGHVDNKNARIMNNNSYTFEMSKSGVVPDYEEIDLYGQYIFFAGLPYFLYTSTITMNKDVNLKLLRNDEMTIDSLFTHLVYPDANGKLVQMPMYDMKKFDSLTKSPLADTIKWVGFINKPLGYGLVSLRLEYDNKNSEGKESPLYQQHTKISKSAGNGRYWNRRLIHDHNVLVPKGSKYYEKNAYLVLYKLNDISNQINYYYTCLKNPLVVYYSSAEK